MHTSAIPDFAGLTVTRFRAGVRHVRSRRVEAYSEEVTPASSNCDFSVPTPVGPCERLLQFIALEGPVPALDPVRVQKAMFLFAIDESSNGDETYDFVPGLYGPSSTRVYRDLAYLVAHDLAATTREVGMGWSLYRPTDEGVAAGQELLAREPDEIVARLLYEIKLEVSLHTAGQLIDDLYDRFPEYASKCVFARTH
jgi:DNA-binding PadR family transcriptional regulator